VQLQEVSFDRGQLEFLQRKQSKYALVEIIQKNVVDLFRYGLREKSKQTKLYLTIYELAFFLKG
jgi:hypothetical protein